MKKIGGNMLKKYGAEIFLVCMAVVISVSMIFLNFYQQINDNKLDLYQEQLLKITEENADTVQEKLLNDQKMINSIADKMADTNSFNGLVAIDILKNNFIKGSAIKVMVDLSHGSSYAADGKIIDSGKLWYDNIVAKGVGIIYDKEVSKQNNGDTIFIIAPIIKNNEVLGIVRGVYDTENITTLFEEDVFEGRGTIQIIDAEGRVVTCSAQNIAAFREDNNILAFIDKNTTNNYGAQDLKKVMNSKQSGFLEGNSKYFGYVPLGINDWYLYTIVPKDILAKENLHIQSMLITLYLKLAVIMLSLLAYCIYYRKKDREEHILVSKKLEYGEEIHKILLSQINTIVFECDFVNKTAQYNQLFEEKFGYTTFVENFPQAFIDKKIIYPDDVEDFLSAYNKLQVAPITEKIAVRIKDIQGEFIWCKICITSFVDERNQLVRAMGIINDINEQKLVQLRFEEVNKRKVAMLSGNNLVFEINVTKDSFLGENELWSGVLGTAFKSNYTAMLNEVANKAIPGADREKYLATFSRNSLLSSFSAGKYEVEAEYRRASKDGRFSWVKLIMYLVKEPASSDIVAVCYLQDIHRRKIKELELQVKNQKDPLTSLYNKVTIKNMVDEYLFNAESREKIHALVVIEVDDFDVIMESQGEFFCDAILTDISDKLRIAFRENDLIGRFDNHEFVVFAKNIKDKEIAIQKARKIQNIFRTTHSDGEKDLKISCSIGISVSFAYGESFTTMYKKAVQVMKDNPKNNRDFFSIYEMEEPQESPKIEIIM